MYKRIVFSVCMVPIALFSMEHNVQTTPCNQEIPADQTVTFGRINDSLEASLSELELLLHAGNAGALTDEQREREGVQDRYSQSFCNGSGPTNSEYMNELCMRDLHYSMDRLALHSQGVAGAESDGNSSIRVRDRSVSPGSRSLVDVVEMSNATSDPVSCDDHNLDFFHSRYVDMYRRLWDLEDLGAHNFSIHDRRELVRIYNDAARFSMQAEGVADAYSRFNELSRRANELLHTWRRRT